MNDGDLTDDIEEKLEILASYYESFYALTQVPEGSVLDVLERITISTLENGHVQTWMLISPRTKYRKPYKP